MTDRAEIIQGTLSQLVGLAEQILDSSLRSKPDPQHRRRDSRFFLGQINLVGAAVESAEDLIIEGGNPIGVEAAILVDCLRHVEQLRIPDRNRSDKWGAVALAVLDLVRRDLALMLERRQAPITTTTQTRAHT